MTAGRNTVSAEKDNPLLLAAALDPRFRTLKFMAAEDATRVKGTFEILAMKETKERACGDPEQ